MSPFLYFWFFCSRSCASADGNKGGRNGKARVVRDYSSEEDDAKEAGNGEEEEEIDELIDELIDDILEEPPAPPAPRHTIKLRLANASGSKEDKQKDKKAESTLSGDESESGTKYYTPCNTHLLTTHCHDRRPQASGNNLLCGTERRCGLPTNSVWLGHGVQALPISCRKGVRGCGTSTDPGLSNKPNAHQQQDLECSLQHRGL